MEAQGPGGSPPPHQPGTPAGWYANPSGPGQRYWDGTKWTDSYQQPPTMQKQKGGGTWWKVLLGMALGAVLLIGGCVALIGGAAEEVSNEIEKEQSENAITNEQARSVKLGTTRRDVEERFGPPKSDQESENEGLGSDSCIYYNLKGGEFLDSWQFCFGGKGKDGKLRSKNRF